MDFRDNDAVSLNSSIIKHFEIADERANIDGGRYRSAVWLGFLLSALAVGAAAWGVIMSHAPPRGGAPVVLWLIGVVILATWPLMPVRHSRPAPHLLPLSKLAVAIAVAGAIYFGTEHTIPFAGGVEVVALVAIMALLAHVWASGAHESWISNRAIAELLRYDERQQPMLAVSLSTAQPAFRIAEEELRLINGSAWLLARIRAHQPLPRSRSGSPISLTNPAHIDCCVRSLHSLLAGQLVYHERRAGREHAIGHRLHIASAVGFFAAALCAAWHLLPSDEPEGAVARWITLGTIVLPSLAAALHAIRGQLESARLAASSLEMTQTLIELRVELLKIETQKGDQRSQVIELRALAARVTDAMMGDVFSWHELVAAQPLGPPA